MPDGRLVGEAAAGAGAGAEGDAASDGGAHEMGEGGRGFGEWVGGRAIVFRLELAADEQSSDPGADGGEDVRRVGVARWAGDAEAFRTAIAPSCRSIPEKEDRGQAVRKRPFGLETLALVGSITKSVKLGLAAATRLCLRAPVCGTGG